MEHEEAIRLRDGLVMQTSRLPLFDPEGSCPKCGNERITINHRQLTLGGGLAIPRCEAMERFCGRCNYGWDERPLEAWAPA